MVVVGVDGHNGSTVVAGAVLSWFCELEENQKKSLYLILLE